MNNLYHAIKEGALLTSGTVYKYNTMTINWGMFGSLWNKSTFICFVRPSTYTTEFLEENEFFSICFFLPAYRQELSYLGTHSGRNIDKVKDVNFNIVELDRGVTFKEAYQTIICKKIATQTLDKDSIPEDIKKVYYTNNDIHKMYIGEIVDIYEDYQ